MTAFEGGVVSMGSSLAAWEVGGADALCARVEAGEWTFTGSMVTTGALGREALCCPAGFPNAG